MTYLDILPSYIANLVYRIHYTRRNICATCEGLRFKFCAAESLRNETLRYPASRFCEEGMDDLRVAIRVAELREKRGMTQTELAAKIHTSAAVISRLERGRNVELKTLRRVAAALHGRLTVEPLAS